MVARGVNSYNWDPLEPLYIEVTMPCTSVVITMAMLKFVSRVPLCSPSPLNTSPSPLNTSYNEDCLETTPRSPTCTPERSAKRARQDSMCADEPDCAPRPHQQDISHYADKVIQSSLSNQLKYDLFTKRFKPGTGFQFPPKLEHGKQRRFQLSWLQRFPWLAYCPKTNGGFCINCMLFGEANLGIFTSRPHTNFTKAADHMVKHTDKPSHKAATVKAIAFLSVMEGKQENVHHMINRGLADRVLANRGKLASIINIIILCGRQCFALRGDKDNMTDVEQDSSNSVNHGNFWALVNFRIQSGDTVLEGHLQNASHNATYTSPIIQNELICVIGDHIRDKIISEVKKCPQFSVIADEVTDTANKEQLSFVLRYVSSDGEIKEDVVDFVECADGITGQAIADKVLGCVQSYTLDPGHIRGQGYDGAGNMAGKSKGAAALITKQHPLALYFHCASHCLNLAVMKSVQVTSIRNMMGTVERMSSFLDGHPKRQTALDRALDSSAVESQKSKLKNVCRTRWVQRIEALETFCELYPAIIICLETICEEGPQKWSNDSLTDARGLLLNISSTDFICAVVVAKACLGYTKALTVSLQAEAKDIITATSEINTVTSTLKDVRENIDDIHSDWFRDVETMCETAGVEASIPRRCGRQQHRQNMPATTPTDYYRRTISVPVVDHMLKEFEDRFTSLHKKALEGLVLIPSALVSMPEEEAQRKFVEVCNLYRVDMPSPVTANAEFHCWTVKWAQQHNEHGASSLPIHPAAALKHAKKQVFPNIHALLTVLCVLPVTSCTSERSHSALKRIKTGMRSTMVNSRLTGLTMMHVHRDIPIDMNAVIDEFARRHPRRMELSNILMD